MRSITYFSTEAMRFSRQELETLQQTFAQANADLEITGILLYKNGNFLQAIEGPAQAVGELWERILEDPRHKDIVRLDDRLIESREFSDWAMGFKNLDDLADIVIPGVAGILNPSGRGEFQMQTELAHRFLMTFAKHHP